MVKSVLLYTYTNTTEHTMQTLAQAKIITTKLGLYRIIAGFTTGNLTQRNADYITTDFKEMSDVKKALIEAMSNLKTDNIKIKNYKE